ncbi:MAG TPA: IS21-like element helper ATPase IstB [Polyangiaceae bacterium]|nr:IS21-like element helper ATPase IstB [Polyangiaceae bacterium]
MLNEPTIEKLKALRLDGMCSAWQEQQTQPDNNALGFDERFGMLVDAEWSFRENKRMKRSLQEAKLRVTQACIEGIDYPARRELDKAVIRQLASCRWVQEHQVVIVTGATGTGKSYIACALAHQACRKGFRALYRRAPRFFDELKLAHADGSYPRLLARFARFDVIVLDDFAIAPVSDQERRDLLEVLEDRQETRATIITSQLDPKHWHDYLSDPTLADAICDRVLSRAHRLVLKGPSRRNPEKTNP